MDEFGSGEMDPPLINESSFSAANPSAYSLAEIWSLGVESGGGGQGLRMGSLGLSTGGFCESSGNRDGSAEESTVTEQSGGGGGDGKKRKEASSEDESSKVVSTSSANDLVGLSFSLVLFGLLWFSSLFGRQEERGGEKMLTF